MSISPTVSFWLNVILILVNALIGVAWAEVLPTDVAVPLLTGLNITATVINGLLHGFSAPRKGPLAS